MNGITAIHAERIRDSRGKATLRIIVEAGDARGAFDVPSGASTCSREAHELRDDDGGVTRAVHAVESEIAPALSGTDVTKQRALDELLISLDGTPRKERLGGNALIGVSIAAARAAASSLHISLVAHLRSLASMMPSRETPRLFVNLINGGKHAEGGSPIQEHQIVTETDNIAQALQQAEQVERVLGDILEARGILARRGDEGGYAFSVNSIDEPFALLGEAVRTCNIPGLSLGADAAASSFFNDGAYHVLGESYDTAALSAHYRSLHETHGLIFLEDPFHEDAVPDFAALKTAQPAFILIGDDLTTTNAESIRAAAKQHAIQAVIIKPNQIGTLTETIEAMKVARENSVHCIVSHRSGETHDDFIADVAYAFGAYGLKAGAPSAPERKVKYERLVEISHDRAHT